MVLILVALSFRREDHPEQPVAREIWCVGTGIKEQLIGSAVVTAIAERQIPQAGYYDRVLVRVRERAEKRSGVRVKGVDFAFFDVANEKHITESTEMGGRADDSPRVDKRP